MPATGALWCTFVLSVDGGLILKHGPSANVPTGTYILSVASPDYSFDQVRIDVQENEVEVRPYAPGTPLNPPSTITLSYPISLVPRQKHAYFVPRETFNLLGMLSNPMMLMMIAAGGMMLGMPYLTVSATSFSPIYGVLSGRNM